MFKGKDQTWKEVIERAKIPERFQYCLRHWMSEADSEGDAERCVKRYLDRVGYILIQDMPDDGILTDYKEMRNRVAEVPASACADIEDILYGTTRAAEETSGFLSEHSMAKPEGKAGLIYEALTRPKRTPKGINMRQQRRERINEMYRKYPGAHTKTCRVDTDGHFMHEGQEFFISENVAAYQPQRVRDDVYYEMDTIIVLRDGDAYHFFDQEYREIDSVFIHPVNDHQA